MEQDKYLVWLSGIKHLGGIRIKRLIEHFGSAKSVWEAQGDDLKKVKGIDKGLCNIIVASKDKKKLERNIDNLEKHKEVAPRTKTEKQT